MQRLTWNEICDRDDFRGRWVVLGDCTYDDRGNACAGAVVDVDDDLVELCHRVRDAERRNCAILFCATGGNGPTPARARPHSTASRLS